MSVYFCWASLMLSSYENSIIAGMVKKGYQVCPATNSGTITQGGVAKAAQLLILKVSHPKKQTDSTIVGTDFINVLDTAKVKYYVAITTYATSEAYYSLSNIELPSKTPNPTQSADEE